MKIGRHCLESLGLKLNLNMAISGRNEIRSTSFTFINLQQMCNKENSHQLHESNNFHFHATRWIQTGRIPHRSIKWVWKSRKNTYEMIVGNTDRKRDSPLQAGNREQYEPGCWMYFAFRPSISHLVTQHLFLVLCYILIMNSFREYNPLVWLWSNIISIQFTEFVHTHV